MWKQHAIIVVLIFFVRCSGTQQDYKDITKDPDFSCKFLGGMYSSLVCSCLTTDKELIIKSESISLFQVREIRITNCGEIRIGAEAVFNIKSLRVIELRNISSLSLDENSLYWIGSARQREFFANPDPNVPSIKIFIENVTVSLASSGAIKGRIQSITFTNTVFKEVAPLAFTSFQLTTDMSFDLTTFEQLSHQSFKNLTMNRLTIKNTVFDIIPSKAFDDIIVADEFLLYNITVDILKPSGFKIINPKLFQLSNSNFDQLNGNAFDVTTRGNVLIRNNTFKSIGMGAFRSITTSKKGEFRIHNITFDMNVFYELNKDSLVIDDHSFNSRYSNVKLSDTCECEKLDEYINNKQNIYELKCLIRQTEWVTVDEYEKYHCFVFSTNTNIILIVVGIILFLLIAGIIGVVCYIKRLNRKKEEGDKQEKLGMISPDGRTYKETELHVFVERSDLLTTDF